MYAISESDVKSYVPNCHGEIIKSWAKTIEVMISNRIIELSSKNQMLSKLVRSSILKVAEQ